MSLKASRVVIGVDLSLTGTAICVLDYKSANIISVQTIDTKKHTGIERIALIKKSLLDCVVKHSSAPVKRAIFVEGYSFGSKGRGVYNLGELGGCCRLLFAGYCGGYWDVPPTSLKKFITGKGNVNKNVMLEKIYRKYGIGSEILRDDNQVDSYGLARMGREFIRWKAKECDPVTYELDSFKGISEKRVLPCNLL